MPRRRHHWFAHLPHLFMRRHRRLSSMRHRRRLSSMRHRRRLSMRRHRHRSSMRHRRRLSVRHRHLSSTRRHRHRLSMRHRRRLSMRHHRHRSFVRRQRRSTRRCAEIPDDRHAPSRHQGVRPALKAHWGPLRVHFSPLPRRLRMAALCARRSFRVLLCMSVYVAIRRRVIPAHTATAWLRQKPTFVSQPLVLGLSWRSQQR